MTNMLPFDPTELITQAYPAFVMESERWETLTESDDAETPKGVDVRTVVNTLASEHTPSLEDMQIVQRISDLVASELDNDLSASTLSFLSVTLQNAARTINDAAKYAIRQARPDTVDVDSDLVECYEAMKNMRDMVNMALASYKFTGTKLTPANVRKDGKKKVIGDVAITDDLTLTVRVGNDGELTLNGRLPNNPAETGKSGRPVLTSKLAFTVNGIPFTPRAGVATQHLAHEIRRLGGDVPVSSDEFITLVNSQINGDFFKAPWAATFGPVTVECSHVAS